MTVCVTLLDLFLAIHRLDIESSDVCVFAIRHSRNSLCHPSLYVEHQYQVQVDTQHAPQPIILLYLQAAVSGHTLCIIHDWTGERSAESWLMHGLSGSKERWSACILICLYASTASTDKAMPVVTLILDRCHYHSNYSTNPLPTRFPSSPSPDYNIATSENTSSLSQ